MAFPEPFSSARAVAVERSIEAFSKPANSNWSSSSSLDTGVVPEGGQRHRHAGDPSGDHRWAQETKLSDGPGQAYRAGRSWLVAIRRSQTGRPGAGRSGGDGAT